MSEWISVEERLPTSSAKYIACVRDRNDAKWTVCADWSCEMRSWFGEFGEIKNKVTHWMPLPESQKEGCDTNGEAKKYTAEEIKELAKKAFEA